MEVEQHGVVVAGGGKARLDPAQRLLAPEAVRNGYDERLRHAGFPRGLEIIWGARGGMEAAGDRPVMPLRRARDCAESCPSRAVDRRPEPRPGVNRAPHNNNHEERTMRLKTRLYLSVAAIGIAAFLAGSAGPVARADRRRHRRRRHRRRGHGPERAGSRRVGDRRDHRSSDPLRQDGRHRRPGPLRRARPAQGQVQGVGAGLRPRRFRQGRRRAGQATQPAPRCRRRTKPRRRSTTRRSTGIR